MEPTACSESASPRACPASAKAPEPPEIIACTLPHMAPEQTGRMNRSVDARSDLYALGVTGIDDSERRLEILGVRDPDVHRPAVQISVMDRGIGLRKGAAERLFETSYTTKPQGMGLGLTISRSIIESHGGGCGPSATTVLVRRSLLSCLEQPKRKPAPLRTRRT